MKTAGNLLDVDRIEGEIRTFLSRIGPIFADFNDDESGCLAHGVQAPDGRFFVKHPVAPRGLETQRRAIAVHASVRHPNLVPILRQIDGGYGPVLVYPWIEGGRLRESHLTGRLPLCDVLGAIAAVIDIHLAIEAAGFVSVDLYDGNLLYSDRIHLIDVDEYQMSPYVRTEERALGSTRFMAPEELERGATIDSRAMVFQLGRAVAVLLDPPKGQSLSRAPWLRPLVERATSARPDLRYQTVAELRDAWQMSRANLAQS